MKNEAFREKVTLHLNGLACRREQLQKEIEDIRSLESCLRKVLNNEDKPIKLVEKPEGRKWGEAPDLILKYLGENDAVQLKELVEALKIPYKSVYTALNQFKVKGIVESLEGRHYGLTDPFMEEFRSGTLIPWRKNHSKRRSQVGANG